MVTQKGGDDRDAHWDHVLWHSNFGDAPRFGTARCPASTHDLLSNVGWKARVLSDTLMPFLDLEAADPIEDYLTALRLFESVAHDVDTVIPGHGSVGGAGQMQARIKQDRAYVQDLRDGGVTNDPRLGPSATLDWLPDVHGWQLQRLAQIGQYETPE